MDDLFTRKVIRPMLIGEEGPAFDSEEYIYELKLDGERCIAYLDPEEGTELRNKRNARLLPKVPELSNIHKQVKKRCILDGELIVLVDGKPDFFEIQRRSLMSNQFKIELLSDRLPATFCAFDILYWDGEQVTDKPLFQRKKLLEKAIKETDRIAVSRYIEQNGTALYELAKKQDLEGIVAKRKDSRYYFDKRTKDWIKCKNMQDDDFVICGYIDKGKGVTSIVLGQYRGKEMIYKGHVTLGVGGKAFERIARHHRVDSPPFIPPKGNENAIWVSPDLVCTIKYMMLTDSGSMRQPVFKGLREDKRPEDCIEKLIIPL